MVVSGLADRMATEPTDARQRADDEPGIGLDENVAGALAYLVGFVSGIVFLVVEDRNEFVRFHAAQSVVVFGMLFAASVLLSVVGTVVAALFFGGSGGAFLIGSVASLVLTLMWVGLGLLSFVLWVYLMVQAYRGRSPKIPVAADLADRIR